MARANLKQTAYERIKAGILSCEYAPGSLLNEDRLCQDLGMSRTPIRDALGRLEQERLITIRPKVGYLVSNVTADVIRMTYESRILVEPYIILNYCTDLSAQQLSELAAIQQKVEKSVRSKGPDIYQYDHEFHSYLVSFCPNSYLREFYTSLSDQNNRLRILVNRSSEKRIRETVSEHEYVLKALKKGDSRAAAEAMKEHLSTALQATLLAFSQSQFDTSLTV